MDPVGYLGPDERWKVLGVAIVKQAVIDYKLTLERQKRTGTDTHANKELQSDAVSFLRSGMCELYSGLDGKILVKKINAGMI